jgi:hypothetical protein
MLPGKQTGRQFKKPSGGDHPPGLEIYFTGRFFTITEALLDGCPDELATISQDDLTWLLSEVGPSIIQKPKGTRRGTDQSRSGAVFAIAARCLRQHKTFDDFCEAVRTDEKTAEWYIEKGVVAGGRELHRAWEHATQQRKDVDAIIAEFNGKYAVVNEAGIAIVYQQAFDPVRKRKRLDRISFSDLCKFYLNRDVAIISEDGKTSVVNVAKLWLSHKDRRQYLGGVVFDPKNTVPADCWNLWTGFAVEPKLGNWSLMREHIRNVICASNPDHFDYVMNWLAYLFQHPNKAGEVAIVLRGSKGAGKGIFGRWVHRAWGQHGMHIANPSHLVGNFNAHLRDCVFLFADEAFFAGDRQHESVLKALITEEVILIEGKYQNAVEALNMLHGLMASNSKWVVPASHDERRYCVLDVADNRLGDYPYFDAISNQMETGGLAAMIHDLLRRDVSKFNVRAFPGSRALDEQKLHSLDTIERWWLTVLSRGFIWRSRFGASVFAEWHDFVTTELLWRSYAQWCQDTRVNRMQTREMLGIFMTKSYAQCRKRKEHIIGEVEVLTTDKDSKVGEWINREAPMMAKMQGGYTVGSLDEARDRATDMMKIVPEWQETSETD